MQQEFDSMEYVFPSSVDWEEWKECRAFMPFEEKVVDFLNALSVSLFRDPETRRYRDVVAFAFFCRRANILSYKRGNGNSGIRLGRGLVFHVAASNVPMNFAYSLTAGLLGGNYNIVRLPSRRFEQADMLVRHICRLAGNAPYKDVAERIALVRYDKADAATAFFSSFCDVRIIWGGDETVRRIRELPIPPRSFDLSFADRYSFAVFRIISLPDEKEIRHLASGFYNDTYVFDQNACSSPHLVIWTGDKEKVEKMRYLFWNALYEEVENKYEFHPILGIDKLTALCRQAMEMPVRRINWYGNKLVRVELERLKEDIDRFRSAGGYFSEYYAGTPDEIVPMVKRSYQTLVYYGFESEELADFITQNRLPGIDRIVPVGAASDFRFIWDGYDLPDLLSRICDLR